ncbi:MAG: hypothetical protein GSR85_07765 [Desulfurococcales archaeon]|nr:hypothetical protein [Desulfurococcales archaeon]
MSQEELLHVKEELESAWREAREYIESGGDVTYAFLNLARRDISNAVDLIEDKYCRGQIMGEKRLLDHALNLAVMAYEWSLGVGGWRYRVKLILKAMKEVLVIFWLQVRKALV